MKGAEEDAFVALYEACRDRLVTQLVALTGERSDATDLVQEAFLRAWMRWDRIANYEDPEGWVRRVAYNLAVGRWRRARRVVHRPTVVLRPVPTPDEHLDLVNALSCLPISHRKAIVLHHLAGLSVEETATELGVPVGTVKSWLSRGRARLALELGDEGPPDKEIVR